ncbi:MAG: T9SS type A sorting domain-containing protein [Bacteroidales bacterium]|nr:T9SS type A sorting domain-containing protein [Bacteroidales bacterium]
MKNITLVLTLLLFVNNLFSQWELKADLSYQYPPLTFNVGKICFTSAQNGYYWLTAGGIHYASYDIMRTVNGWQSNTLVYSQGGNYNQYYIRDMVFINDTIGYKLSGYGPFLGIDKTVNGGSEWTTVANNTSMYLGIALSYPSEDLGFYLRSVGGSPNFQVVASDHGSCSIIDFSENFVNASYINFINDSTGFLFCRDTLQNYVCMRTTDAAATWNFVLSDSLNSFSELHFPTDQIGYLAANNGRAYKTTDGGVTWNQLTTSNNRKLNSVFFLDEDFGFFAGDSGLILRTINGGQNWTIDSTFTKDSIKKVFFADSLTGYFATSTNKIFKTGFVGIPENILTEEKTESIILFPNPADNYISLKNSQKLQRASIKIFSNQGKEVSTLVNWVSDSKLDISKLASGLYFLQISTTNKVLTGRFIKK